MSGRKSGPAHSEANSLPVRPNPVATSSQISSTPCARQAAPHDGQVGRIGHEDAGGALDQRLDDHGGERVGVGLDAPTSLGRPVGHWHSPGVRITGNRSGSNTAVPNPPSPSGQGADGVPVVGVAERQERGRGPAPPG